MTARPCRCPHAPMRTHAYARRHCSQRCSGAHMRPPQQAAAAHTCQSSAAYGSDVRHRAPATGAAGAPHGIQTPRTATSACNGRARAARGSALPCHGTHVRHPDCSYVCIRSPLAHMRRAARNRPAYERNRIHTHTYARLQPASARRNHWQHAEQAEHAYIHTTLASERGAPCGVPTRRCTLVHARSSPSGRGRAGAARTLSRQTDGGYAYAQAHSATSDYAIAHGMLGSPALRRGSRSRAPRLPHAIPCARACAGMRHAATVV